MIKSCSFLLVCLIFVTVFQAQGVPVENATIDVQISVIQQTIADEAPSDFILFIGRFHPILVHIPIGFLLLAFILECCALFDRFKQIESAVPLALLLGGISAVFAAVTGYLLSSDGGYGEALLTTHMWLGISVAVLSLLAFILRIKFFIHPLLKKIYAGVLVLMFGTLMAAGHYGGSLTHGSDYLTRYMPDPLRTVAGLPPKEEKGIKKIDNIDSALVFKDIIHPILDTRCVSCHNPEKKKGELLLTTFEELMEGGENGPVVEAGSTENSDMIRRLSLPEADDDHMPPEGKLQLTNDQINLIAWWIDQGAPAGNTVSELQVPEDISKALLKLTGEGKSFLAKTEVPKAGEQIIEKIQTQNIKISPIARQQNFLQVRVSKSGDSLDSSDIESLVPLSQQITWLDLAGTGIQDSSLSALVEFKNLTRLNLERTVVGDSTLKIVSSLPHLEYLNVYATKISDQGLQYIEGNKNLKSLYLWQTKVSKEAVQKLKKNLPDLYIDTGWNTENNAQQNTDKKESEGKDVTENPNG